MNVRGKKAKVLLSVITFLLVLSFGVGVKSVSDKKVAAAEREKQIAIQEEERKKAEEETRLKAEEEARLKAEEEKKKKAIEEEARRKAEEQRIIAEKAKADEEKKKIKEKQQVNKQQSSSGEEVLTLSIPIKERIERYLGDGVNRFGFIYYDLSTKEKISINENKVFTAASTYKVGLNMVAYEDVRKGALGVDTGIQYNANNDYEGGTGVLQGQINTTLQQPVQLQKLLDLSITHSDNIATRMVSRILGGTSKVRSRMNAMVGLSCDTSNNKTTSEIQFRLLKKIYDNRNDKYYSHLLDKMKSTIFHDRLDKYLPYNRVAHKIGNYGAAVNDIGIVFSDKPYIIVTYSEGLSGAAEKIAKISKMIYDEQLKK